MSRRWFRVQVTRTFMLDVDDRVLDVAKDPAWRRSFYNLRNRVDVAEHLAFNVSQGRLLSQLDGFADQPNDAVEIVLEEDAEVSAREVRRARLAGER